MKLLLQSVTVLAVCQVASAHYLFGRLIVNKTITPTFSYVREVGPFGGEALNLTWPLYDVNHIDFRCGRQATTTGPKTKIATVIAGSEVGFQTGEISVEPGVDYIFHIGPGSIWLSKAPGSLESYTGDGDWFKIASATGTGYTWDLDLKPNWNVTIPKNTPPGKYLLRMEHFYPRPDMRERPDLQPQPDTQFFINCAQIEIIGEGGGTPGPLAKIPGVYKVGQRDVFFDAQGMYNVSKYVAPNPPVWKG